VAEAVPKRAVDIAEEGAGGCGIAEPFDRIAGHRLTERARPVYVIDRTGERREVCSPRVEVLKVGDHRRAEQRVDLHAIRHSRGPNAPGEAVEGPGIVVAWIETVGGRREQRIDGRPVLPGHARDVLGPQRRRNGRQDGDRACDQDLARRHRRSIDR
jgi:hypothetical protein